jgi:leucyl/phenylalanyl-tRNA--protein transferase
MDRDFPAVINACALPREPDGGTWLVPEMISAYRALHVHGIAHSVEVWQDGALAGGLYGVAIGGIFFGESMFTRVDNASKVALVHLCQRLNAGASADRLPGADGHLVRMGAGRCRGSASSAGGTPARPPGADRQWDDGTLA